MLIINFKLKVLSLKLFPFLLSLILAGFLAGSASAQPDPGDDPNEYANQDIFTTPVISEFMASNGSKEPLAEGELLDEDGESSDWIEIYNPTAEAVHLGGWYLTNDADNLEQWKFPGGVVLNPGQFLIVFASGKNRAAANAELHTSFRLDVNGEYLALVQSDGETIAHEYGPKFPAAVDRHLIRPGAVRYIANTTGGKGFLSHPHSRRRRKRLDCTRFRRLDMEHRADGHRLWQYRTRDSK